MKALILNSGIGNRMGELTKNSSKCLLNVSEDETILSRQLRQLHELGIEEVIITTGAYEDEIKKECFKLDLPLRFKFVKNERFNETNYIYSIYKAKDYLSGDLILIHGDLVFEDLVLEQIFNNDASCVVVSSSADLNKKDFKVQIENDSIKKIGVDLYDNALLAQPLYKLCAKEWKQWINAITSYCDRGLTDCYAENALNTVLDNCPIKTIDIKDQFCAEIDTPEDLQVIRNYLNSITTKTVYLCFGSDMIHGGHINILQKASRLGRLTVGVLTDEVIASYKRYPLIPFSERKELMKNIKGVTRVVSQNSLSYVENLLQYKPDYVVHGDDWETGFQKSIRDEVINTLKIWGGELVEYPYSKSRVYEELEKLSREELSMPERRRGRLRKLLDLKGLVSIIEAHSGITGLIAEKTTVLDKGKAYQFDGMWISSLCDSTSRGKPDIELVDMSSRFKTIDEIMDVTTKPIILDGDTGGLIEHFVYNIRTLERMGVSAIIIEDKTGLKKNSLFGNEVEQTQDTVENFCRKIKAGKCAKKTREFMIIARIESLILEKGMEDAINRAFSYVEAGADGIMIHSRKKEPTEIFEFCDKFRRKNKETCLVVVPTSFNEVREEELARQGINIVIYANQLTRSGFPAMQNVAKKILLNHRAKEADELCMSIKDILNLIPEE